jgi:hypothetical protein
MAQRFGGPHRMDIRQAQDITQNPHDAVLLTEQIRLGNRSVRTPGQAAAR